MAGYVWQKRRQCVRAFAYSAAVAQLVFLVSCGSTVTTTGGDAQEQAAARETVKLRNTYYLLIPETDYPLTPKDADVLAMDGTVLARVNSGFKKRLDLEGSGKLKDGRVLNFMGRDAQGKIRYAFTVHPYGRGVGDCELVPYHSAAVDPTVVPIGSVLRIRETVGMLLPDGSRSDGLWHAVDIGNAIKGDRIDLFTGTDTNGVYLDKAGITHLQALTADFVSKPTGHTCADEDPR